MLSCSKGCSLASRQNQCPPRRLVTVQGAAGKGGKSLNRRSFLLTAPVGLLLKQPSVSSADTSSPAFLQQLLPGSQTGDQVSSWLQGTGDTISNPGNSWALTNKDRQLYYPAWLEGTWSVSARFRGASFPLGQRFINKDVPGVLKASMIVSLSDVGAAMERTVEWQMRWVKAPEGVVLDRPYSVKQQADALLGYSAVTSVEYDAPTNPTRMAVVYRTPRRTGRAGGGSNESAGAEYDSRKAEIFINNRGMGGPAAAGGIEGGAGAPADWCGYELYRQVTQAARQGAVGDYMNIMRIIPGPPESSSGSEAEKLFGSESGDQGAGVGCSAESNETGRSCPDGERALSRNGSAIPSLAYVTLRVAAFLQPQDALYFESGGRAVAVYDYTLAMSRMPV